ncbi:hypothetical protein ICW40_11920 [Actinotalea ferrariae]|uniref:hypothetical protein n=1 Tax=Actinotalea ferrariae TaxID=1386098 RepID=UPI001C8CE6E4|nr:hypothetical protein [Actinotalea ferrariae]MBX9245509.1 hypothetical protein [Actinotalea ferrariae]
MTMTYQMPQQRVVPCSGYATAGFVFALMGLSPLALILCGIAWQETRSGERGGHAFTVAGLVIGGVALALLVAAIALAATGVSILEALWGTNSY